MFFYFPPVCEDALGLERGLYNVTASTYKKPGYEPWRGRLNHAGIWRPSDNNRYHFLQVSFDHVMAITGIAIQGDEASCGRVRRFFLYYGLDGRRFETYVDPIYGNVSIIITDCAFIVTHCRLEKNAILILQSNPVPRIFVTFVQRFLDSWLNVTKAQFRDSFSSSDAPIV